MVLLSVGHGVVLRLPMPPRSSWILLLLLFTGFAGEDVHGVILTVMEIRHIAIDVEGARSQRPT